MIVTRTFRIERHASVNELNDVLRNLREDQLVEFSAVPRGNDSIEITLTYESLLKFEVLETHPHTSGTLPHASKPTEVALLLSAPVDTGNVSLRYNEASVDPSLITFDQSKTLVHVNISGLTQDSGDHYLDGRIKSNRGIWIGGDCLTAYATAASTAITTAGDELPHFQRESTLACIYHAISSGQNTTQAMQEIISRSGIEQEDLIRIILTQKTAQEMALLVLYKRRNPPVLTRSDPNHGAVLPNGIYSHGKLAFSRRLHSDTPVSVYIDGVLVTGELQPSETDYKYALNTDEGTHLVELRNLMGRDGDARKYPIILTYTVAGYEVVLDHHHDNRYYTESEIDERLHPDEPNGLLYPGGDDDYTTITFDDSSGTITLEPVGDSMVLFSAGTRFEYTTPQVITMTKTEGDHWVYLNGSGTFVVTDGELDTTLISQYALVCHYYWDNTNSVSILRGDERHGIQMDGATHRYLHETRGCQYQTGLLISGYTLNTSTNDAIRIGWSAGEIDDEDLHKIISASAHPATIPVFYRMGAATIRRKLDSYPFVYPGSTTDYSGTNYAAYNELSGASWQLTELATNDYFVTWICGTTALDYPVIAICGQLETTTLTQAQNRAFQDLVLTGMPFAEITPLFKLIYFCNASYGTTGKVRLIEVEDFRYSLKTGSGYVPITHSGLPDIDTSGHDADIIAVVNPSTFTGVLSSADADVETALQTLDDHVHDSRYYTESEVDSLLSGLVTVETKSGADFTTGELPEIQTASKKFGVRVDAGNETLQINIAGVVYKFVPV